jgi:hypothetical protein
MDDQGTVPDQPTPPINQPEPAPNPVPPVTPAPAPSPPPINRPISNPVPPVTPQPQPPTPPINQPQPSPAPQQQNKPHPKPTVIPPKSKQPKSLEDTRQNRIKNFGLFIIIVVVVLVAVVGIYTVFSKGIISFSTTTISATTTIVGGNLSLLNGCSTVPKSGKYYINYNIKTSIASGACINVTASNVSISCNGNQVIGSGPFSGVPPFTYGILINGNKNVSVTGCSIENFSYGIFAVSSNALSIKDNNISVNYISNIYLSNVHYSNISNNYMSKSASIEGSIYLTNGTANTTIYNNTVLYNQFYGININASGNLFSNNLINGTQYSLICSPGNGYVISGKAYSNTCFNSTGCGFFECRGINIPPNISKVALSKVITSCGLINSSGSYQLSGNINMRNYLNTSNPLTYLIPCFDVMASNTYINCNGFSITNSTTAFYINSRNNITLNNCRITNSKIGGILLQNSTDSHISNTVLINDSYGIILRNSSINSLLNITALKNSYSGLYLSSAYSNNFQSSNFSLNGYGAYLTGGSISNNFNKDVLENNSNEDIYAAQGSANATLNLAQSTFCGYTNAVWANCKHFAYTNISYMPLNSCGVISTPGNYLLTTSLFGEMQRCLQISSSNVRLSCGGHSIVSYNFEGAAIAITDSNNVSVSNCSINDFGTDINVSGSDIIKITNIRLQGGYVGISLDNISNALVSNITLNNTQNFSIYLRNTVNTTLFNNNITYGHPKNIAIAISNSTHNIIMNNTGSSSSVGLQFSGKSANNTVVNNTMHSDTLADYACIGNGGISSENGGINYGITKIGCKWLAVLTKTGTPSVQCELERLPSLITFSQDGEYSFGSTCFNILSNSTTINCQGHTIIATNGGTFAYFANSSKSSIVNCVLKGFTTPIVTYDSQGIEVENNTFLTLGRSTGISVKNSGTGSIIKFDNVSGASVGINITNANYGMLENNYVSNSILSYALSNVTSYLISNNTAAASTTDGFLLSNSTENMVQNNNFASTAVGIQCIGRSSAESNNTDVGSNYCTNQLSCNWLKSPGCNG